MKKTLLILGGSVLVVGAVFAGRASVKGTATQLWAAPVGFTTPCLQVATGGLTVLVSTTTGGQQATIKSNNGTIYNLYESSVSGNCNRQVFFN